MMSRRTPQLLLAAIALLLLIGWLWRHKSRPAPESTAVAPVLSRPTGQPATNAPAPPPGFVDETAIGDRTLDAFNTPGGSVEGDLRAAAQLLDTFRVLIKGDDPLPLGANEDIVAALFGRNRVRTAFLRTNHPAINAQGQWIDRWGTPLFFHAQSRSQIDIRSAGPDRALFTDDDVQRNANGTLTRGAGM
jgi:hypothetical protein